MDTQKEKKIYGDRKLWTSFIQLCWRSKMYSAFGRNHSNERVFEFRCTLSDEFLGRKLAGGEHRTVAYLIFSYQSMWTVCAKASKIHWPTLHSLAHCSMLIHAPYLLNRQMVRMCVSVFTVCWFKVKSVCIASIILVVLEGKVRRVRRISLAEVASATTPIAINCIAFDSTVDWQCVVCEINVLIDSIAALTRTIELAQTQFIVIPISINATGPTVAPQSPGEFSDSVKLAKNNRLAWLFPHVRHSRYVFSPKHSIRQSTASNRLRQHRTELLFSWFPRRRRRKKSLCKCWSECRSANDPNVGRDWCELMRKQCMLLCNGWAIDGAKYNVSASFSGIGNGMLCAVLRHQFGSAKNKTK